MIVWGKLEWMPVAMAITKGGGAQRAPSRSSLSASDAGATVAVVPVEPVKLLVA